jgi:o-succinylbenzoate synthase
VTYLFSFSPYSLPFLQPLQTHHGRWTRREGIWVKLTQADNPQQYHYGEIAPLPWFGTETFEQAIAVCQTLPSYLDGDAIASIPDTHPCCQFGLESAWEQFQPHPVPDDSFNLPYCALLPTGNGAFQVWQVLYHQGYRHFKWKIGIASGQLERDRVQKLLDTLPASCHLRLDANGGLTLDEAKNWLDFCDRQLKTSRQSAAAVIEFLEQPLSPDAFPTMQDLAQDYATPIALDESVATLSQLRRSYESGWTGVFVIKPAIAGSPRALINFCQTHSLDIVLSSVFETPIGRQACLALAPAICHTQRALGYGIQHWFGPESQSTPS